MIVLKFSIINSIRWLKFSLWVSILVWIFFIIINFLGMMWVFLEFFSKFDDFFVCLNIFSITTLISILCSHSLWFSCFKLSVFSNRFVWGEKVSEFSLKLNWIIKRTGSSWTFGVEPKDWIKSTSVDCNFVFQCFLHKTIHIILLKHSALSLPLQRWLIEGVHFIL